MGSGTSSPVPGSALGGYGYTLKAVVGSDGVPQFVVPPARGDAGYAEATSDAKAAKALAEAEARAGGGGGSGGGGDGKAAEDAKPLVWEECPLRHVMTREQLGGIVAKVNAAVLPLAFEARALVVKPAAKKKPAMLTIDHNGDGRGPNSEVVWGNHTRFNQELLAQVVGQVTARLADGVSGVDAVTIQIHTPGELARMGGGDAPADVYLLFVLREAIGAAGGAGGAGGGPPASAEVPSSSSSAALSATRAPAAPLVHADLPPASAPAASIL
eukprot:CAMPEP_0203809494 /NCGR_PEP_ID=MMETSP0115-20131106/2318_1 /ASSEMBLY_ACC=CAM_ASM_000227 /TAXON_ID=33651 /ORGANISM="Bicosoecid sp, Strain ms1" /LENGTH=270 /DNA_ID=CAMNT_0050718229 /DNA_START=46 /DNA_END=858 /DNA_ORIENTATION=+